MIGWLIVSGILLVTIVVLIIVDNKTYSEWVGVVAVFCTAVLLFLILLIIIARLGAVQSTNVFENQSAYVNSHIVTDPLENAVITNKKIELNDWLFKAQWAQDKFGIFSFYPESIQEFEPIQ